MKFYGLALLGPAHTMCGRYGKALPLIAESLHLRPNFQGALMHATVAHALAGDLAAARQSLLAYQQVAPEMTIAMYRQRLPHLSAAGAEVYVKGLRLAGMPE